MISIPLYLALLSVPSAHAEAFENAKILHRDISVGNVIISDRGGLLIDWDLAKDVKDLEKISRQPFRTVSPAFDISQGLYDSDVLTSLQGTWQFIAARLLQARESAVHTPADDWESFFHVLSWVVLRFTRHGLNSAQLTNELRNTYDDSYVDDGKVYGGENKKSRIKSRFITSDVQVPPGPLLDLLKDLLNVLALRYEDPPTREAQERYELSLQAVARDPSLAAILVDHPVKLYHELKEKLKASWMIDRFREAANSQMWDMGPGGQRFENPLTRVDEVVITTKRRSEFSTDMPRQSKKFKPTPDSGDDATAEDTSEADPDDIEAEAASEDGEATDEQELDDYVVAAKWDEAETDWEDDEGEPIDESRTDSEYASE
jgi:hypothetical protein